METIFAKLKEHFENDTKAAASLGLSYNRFYQWKRNPEKIPPYGRRLLELAVESLDNGGQKKKTEAA